MNQNIFDEILKSIETDLIHRYKMYFQRFLAFRQIDVFQRNKYRDFEEFLSASRKIVDELLAPFEKQLLTLD